jgi:hypothetical protein
MLKNRDYNEDLKIDVKNLEGEWVEQPSLYMYYSEAYSEAIRDRDNAKNDLEIADAQLDRDIRRDWEKHFDKPPTETAIKGWIIQQEKHKKQLAIFSEKSHNANLLQSAKNAFDHRRKALENLVSLMITGFHSEPKVSKQITQGVHLGLKKKTVVRNRS